MFALNAVRNALLIVLLGLLMSVCVDLVNDEW